MSSIYSINAYYITSLGIKRKQVTRWRKQVEYTLHRNDNLWMREDKLESGKRGCARVRLATATWNKCTCIYFLILHTLVHQQDLINLLHWRAPCGNEVTNHWSSAEQKFNKVGKKNIRIFSYLTSCRLVFVRRRQRGVSDLKMIKK